MNRVFSDINSKQFAPSFSDFGTLRSLIQSIGGNFALFSQCVLCFGIAISLFVFLALFHLFSFLESAHILGDFLSSLSTSSVNSPSRGYKVRLTSAGLAECGCSYHSHRHESSVESDEGSSSLAVAAGEHGSSNSSSSNDNTSSRVVVAREAGEQ